MMMKPAAASEENPVHTQCRQGWGSGLRWIDVDAAGVAEKVRCAVAWRSKIKQNVLQVKSSRRDRRCHSRAQRVIAVITVVVVVVVIRAGEAGCGQQVADTARGGKPPGMEWDGIGWDGMLSLTSLLLS
jgi:hypothetical protein